jgi:hypothetical protein
MIKDPKFPASLYTCYTALERDPGYGAAAYRARALHPKYVEQYLVNGRHHALISLVFD